MHAKTRRGIHLADAAADLAIALSDVLRQEVHASHVESDGAHGALGHLAVVGMNDVGDIGGGTAGGQVGGRAQIHDLTLPGHRLGGKSRTREHLVRLRIELESREHFLVSHPAARIGVHDFDQLRDAVLAVAHHVPGRAPRRGHQLTVHHQKAMIVALQKGLDDHRARMLARHGVAVRHFLITGQADGNTAPVVAVVGLGDDRKADALRGAHRLRFVLHQLLLRYRQPESCKDLVGLLLVTGELDGDMRGAPGDGRLDALLVLAVAELHQ